MTRSGSLARLAILALVTVPLLPGCTSGSAVNAISSTIQPGYPIITFPQTYDRRAVTVIASNPAAQQAGVNARAFLIAEISPSATINVLTMDTAGNLGIRGSYNATIEWEKSGSVVPVSTTALDLVRQWNVRLFRLKNEASTGPLHIGLISRAAPKGPAATGSSFDLNETILVNRAAIEELDQKVQQLQAEVDELRGQRTP